MLTASALHLPWMSSRLNSSELEVLAAAHTNDRLLAVLTANLQEHEGRSDDG